MSLISNSKISGGCIIHLEHLVKVNITVNEAQLSFMF